MKRREFITLVGGAAAAWPLVARAQQPKMPVIGFLNGQSLNSYPERIVAFNRGLKETGYVERQNVTIEYRWADGQNDRLPALVRQLISLQVKVIVATGGNAAQLASKAATSTIPIVFTSGGDPVKLGLVASLNRPGGNATGVSFLTVGLGPKRLGLLNDMAPTANGVALLINPTSPEAEPFMKDVESAARALGKPLQVFNTSTESEIDAAFAALTRQRDLVLVVGADPSFTSRRKQIVALAARHSIPAIYPSREYVVDGGLMSYGADVTDQYRLAGVYTGRILKGEKPAEMPVQQPTKFELVINRNAAKILGLKIPDRLYFTADEVIE